VVGVRERAKVGRECGQVCVGRVGGRRVCVVRVNAAMTYPPNPDQRETKNLKPYAEAAKICLTRRPCAAAYATMKSPGEGLRQRRLIEKMKQKATDLPARADVLSPVVQRRVVKFRRNFICPEFAAAACPNMCHTYR